MKNFLTFILFAVSLGMFAACGNSQVPATTAPAVQTPTEPQKADTAEPIQPKPLDNFPYPTVINPITWDAINAIPIKSTDMTIDEMRQLCVDFMRLSKTATFVASDNMQFEKNTSGTVDEMYKGVLYAGLPYVGRGGCGNVYRMMDYVNEAGVLDMEHAIAYPALFGNHCSSCTYWAWGRVINSVGHAFTANIIHNKGYLRVGPYTYDDNQPQFTADFTSDMICAENGLDIMCESYAQLQPADGLVNYHTGGGHVVMASSAPHIEYVGGKINPATSYITILEQGQGWAEHTTEAGDVVQLKTSVDKKMTFLELFNGAYMPFTYAEFLGTKPVEETVCSINLSDETVSDLQLFSAKVTANFGISDIYVRLYNAKNQEVYRLAVRATNAGIMEMNITKNGTNAFAWGDYEKLSGEYAVEISVQLSTGERPVVYSGKVAIAD